MSEAPARTTCPSCGSTDMQERCPRCGQEAWRGRLTLRRAARDLFDALTDLDGRLPRTFLDLVVRPGTVARDQIEGRTIRHVPSLRYLLLVAATVTVLTVVSGAGVILQGAELPSSSPPSLEASRAMRQIQEANQAVLRWFQVLLMAIVPVQAILSWLFFERARLYLAEHLVFNAYVVAQQTLLYVPFIPLIASGPQRALPASLAYMALSFAYMGWAYTHFFRGSLPGTLARFAAVALLSYAAYFVAITAGVVGWLALRDGFG